MVTPGFVRAAHELGIRVDVWTIDHEAGMRRLLGYGVDGIMTDRPDILTGLLQGAGKRGTRAYARTGRKPKPGP